MPADEPLLRGARADDADAFAVAVHPGDERTAEQWLRSGLEGAPAWMRILIVVVHRRLLRFRLGPMSSPAHVLGWSVEHAEPEVVRISAGGPLLRAVIVGRRVADRVVLTTSCHYERPRLTRALWTAVGPVHRRVAPFLLEGAAEAGRPVGSPTPS